MTARTWMHVILLAAWVSETTHVLVHTLCAPLSTCLSFFPWGKLLEVEITEPESIHIVKALFVSCLLNQNVLLVSVYF